MSFGVDYEMLQKKNILKFNNHLVFTEILTILAKTLLLIIFPLQ